MHTRSLPRFAHGTTTVIFAVLTAGSVVGCGTELPTPCGWEI